MAEPTTATQRYTLLATGLGLFMIFLDALIVNVALPAIQADFHVGEAGLQWVVTAYGLGMAVAIMSSATLADMQGRRKFYLLSVTLFTLSSIACGAAPSLGVLNIARAFQGVAAATVNVTSLALLSAAFPDPKRKAWAIGIWTGIAATALAIGPTVGGLLVQSGGWRSIFYVNVPIGLAVFALTWRFVAESRDERARRFDVPGQVSFALLVGSFAYAVIEGPHVGWLTTPILLLFVLAFVSLVAFVHFERESADPMMDIALFGQRTYALAAITLWTVMFSMYGMLLVMTQYLQNVQGYSPTAAGLLLLPYSIASATGSMLAGYLVGKAGSRVPIVAGMTTLIVGFSLMIVGMPDNTFIVVCGLIGGGLGSALCVTPTTSLAMSAVTPDRAGMASGIMSAQRATGSTVGFAVLGSILAGWLGATLDLDLVGAIPDPVERRELTAVIIAHANPRAYVAEIGPGRPIVHADETTRRAILAAADGDFVQGIRLALATAIALIALVLAAGFAWFPRARDPVIAGAVTIQPVESG